MELVDLPRRLTLEQAAKFLRVAPLDVHRAATAGELPTVQLDGQLLVDTRALLHELGVQTDAAGNVRPALVHFEDEDQRSGGASLNLVAQDADS